MGFDGSVAGPNEESAVWKRISSYGEGYVPRSLLEQQIVLQSWHYEWSGGEPDPGQLPEGYRQLPHDRTRAVRRLQPDEWIVRAVVVVLAIWMAIMVAGSL